MKSEDQLKSMVRIEVQPERAGLPSEQIEFAKRVQELPDSLFADDDEVQRLVLDAELKELRAKRVALGVPRDELARRLERLREQLAIAEKELSLAALDDALDGGHDFSRSIELAANVEHLRRVLAVVEPSAAILAKNPSERAAPFADEARKARQALNSCLAGRKREYLRGHLERMLAAAPKDADVSAVVSAEVSALTTSAA